MDNIIENEVKITRGTKLSGIVEPIDDKINKIFCMLIIRPKHGSVKVERNGNWIYIPNKTYTGEDEFHIKVAIREKDPKYIKVSIEIGDKEEVQEEDENIIKKIIEQEEYIKIGNKEGNIYTIENVLTDIKIRNTKIVSNRFKERRLIIGFEVKYKLYINYVYNETESINEEKENIRKKEEKEEEKIHETVKVRRFNSYVELPKGINISRKDIRIKNNIIYTLYKPISENKINHFLVLNVEVDLEANKKS
jgi:hypothetical protein